MSCSAKRPPAGGVYYLLSGSIIAALCSLQQYYAAVSVLIITGIWLFRHKANRRRAVLLGVIGAAVTFYTVRELAPLSGVELRKLGGSQEWRLFQSYNTMHMAQNRSGVKVLIRNVPPNVGELVRVSGFAVPVSTAIKVNHVDETGEIRRTSTLAESSFSSFCIAQGVSAIIYPQHIEPLAAAESWRSYAEKIRRSLVGRLQQILPPENAQITAALLFGERRNLNDDLRKNMIVGGIIHLFSVSGLHVGVMVLLSYWMFRFLPSLRWRAALAVLLAGGYVVICGAQTPAMRAWLMLAILFFGQMTGQRFRSLSVLAFTAVIFIWYNPGTVLDTGWQLSFIVTMFLLLWSENRREYSQVRTALESWKPPMLRQNRTWSGRAADMLGSCTVAYLAGMPLLLMTQELFVPAAILLNIILVPLIPVLFGVGMAAMVLPFLAPAEVFLTNFLSGIAAFGAASYASNRALIPPLWGCILLTFFLFLIVKNQPKWRYAGLAGYVGWCVVIFGGANVLPRQAVMAVGGGQDTPFFIVVEPGANLAAAFGDPSYQAADALQRWSSLHGVRRLDFFMLPNGLSRSAAGVKELAAGMELIQLLTPLKKAGNPPIISGENTIKPIFLEKEQIWRYGKANFTLKNGFDMLNYDNCNILVNELSPGLRKISVNNSMLKLANRRDLELFVWNLER